ncbi:ABC transporter permease subunit [Photobacterium kagoshimensis]|uniref:ABC transporter permease subunit n=1 Tax=Photobacterium kagoshimensis TaxID=2910242 RepID=UPI003D12CEA6
MADASTLFIGESRSRRVKDKMVRIGVIAGGISVLLMLVLIFFYLLYVILPSFKPVTVEPQTSFVVPTQDRTLAVGIEEQNLLAYRFGSEGELQFVSLPSASSDVLSDLPPQNLSPQHLLIVSQPTAFAHSLPRDQLFAYGTANGGVVVVTPNVKTHFTGTTKQQVPSIDYPLGKAALQLDPNGQALELLALTVQRQQGIIVGVTDDRRLVGLRLSAPRNSLQEQVSQWSEQAIDFSAIPTYIINNVQRMALTPDGRTLYLQLAQQLAVVALDKDENNTFARLREVVTVTADSATITDVNLLSGANSLLITTDHKHVSQWFEVLNDGKWSLTHIRDFPLSDSPVTQVAPEHFRKSFFTWQQNGTLSAFYATAKSPVFESKKVVNAFSPSSSVMAISPRADRLLVVEDDNWQIFEVENPHPEMSFASLWQQVWYEGYPESDYVWQSTSASDEFEPKLSLVPIVFGTLKAALYAMFFAIPLALAGAIYTAYFMSSKMRSIVKPTVEIMEALPTVILGFLAGIWLAPIVESNLVGIMLSIVMFPLMIFMVGALWSALPDRWVNGLPNGLHILLLMPIIILTVYGCFALGPMVETICFAGDARIFLSNELGIGYDQRNALVVGIAMGFAVIPTIFSIAEDAIFSVPGHLTSGSLALGATHWQTLTRVVLLTASPGIFSAIMMGLGRAVGETMIVLMATGNTPIMDWNVLEGLRTLSATIAIEMPESEVGSSHYRVLFLAAFVLFVFTFFFNTIAELVRQRLRDKYSSL